MEKFQNVNKGYYISCGRLKQHRIKPTFGVFLSTLSTGTNLDSASEERELEMEIVNLIEQLPINNPLEVQEFVNIDDEMSVRESASVDDIVEVMNEQEEGGESEEEDRETEVKMNDVIVGVDNVVKHIQQQNNLGVVRP